MVLLLACEQGFEPPTDGAVIVVGDRSIYPANIEDSFERFRGDTVSVDVFKENIVARELFITHALAIGLDNDREVLRLTHERSREILQAQWLSYVLDQVELEDQTIRDFWETMGTGISYTCFYHEDSLVMDSVLNMVKNGENLSRLAVDLAMDEIIRQTEGIITLDDRNFSNVMDFEYLLSAEVGDVIDPFPVTLGWRMLQIDSIWTYEPFSFDVDSSRIAGMLLSRARESRKKFLEDSLKVVYNVQINTEAIELMASKADARGQMFGIFSPDELDLVAVSWDGGSRDLFSVTENILGLPGYMPRYTNKSKWLSSYATRLAMFDIQMEEAISYGLDTIPEIARTIEAKHWEAVLDKYYEVVLAPSIQVDSVLMNEVYLELRDELPITESRVFHVLFLASNEKIATAESMMSSGQDLLESVDTFEFFPPILAEGEETITVPLSRHMIPENDRESLFSLIVADAAIIQLSDSTALWLKLDKVIEERIPELHEIRERVVSEASQRMETTTIEALVDSLSNEYHLYIDEGYFEGFYIPMEVDSVLTTESSLEVI